MSHLRIGLIGFGAWARDGLLPALQLDGRARLASAAAATARSRSAIRTILGPGTRVFASFEELLAGPTLDAVLIALPDSLHEEALQAALESGVHVFYEPPVADTRTRIPPMLRRLLHARQITHANLELGLLPVVGRCSDLVSAGTIGRVQMAGIRLQSSWGPVMDADLCNIHHLCPWYVDVMNRVLGGSPERVLVLDGKGTRGRRQNQSLGHFLYGDTLATFQVHTASLGSTEVTMEFHGDDGDLLADLWNGRLQFRTRTHPEWRLEDCPAIQPYADWPGTHESVRMFLEAVRSGDIIRGNYDRITELHLTGLAADASKDSGRWEAVPSAHSIL